MNGLFSRKFCLSITFALLLLSVSVLTQSQAAEVGEFSGTWVANGNRTVIPFGDDRTIATFTLSGHVNLENALGKKKDYWSECVGLTDTVIGIQARCVWKDLDGPEVYITLQSDRLQEGNRVSGTIVGGSGRLKGISGELSFLWSNVIIQQEGGTSSVTGQTLDLRGSYLVP